MVLTLPPTRTDTATSNGLTNSSQPVSSESLDEEIRMLEQELERKKLEGQIRQLEEQLQAVQTPPSGKKPAVSIHSTANSSLAASNHLLLLVAASNHSASNSVSLGTSLHSIGASSTDYEEQIVEVSDGGTEYEVITEYVEEDASESQDLDRMNMIQEPTEVETDTDEESVPRREVPMLLGATAEEKEKEEDEDEEELLPRTFQGTVTSPVTVAKGPEEEELLPPPPQNPAPSSAAPVKAPKEEVALPPPPQNTAPSPVAPVKARVVVGSVLMPPNKKRPSGNAKAAAAAAATAKREANTEPAAPSAPVPAGKAETNHKGGLFQRLSRKKAQPSLSTAEPDLSPEQDEANKPTHGKEGKKMVRKVRRIRIRSGNEVDASEVKTPPKPFSPRTIAALPPSPEGQETPLELMVGPKLTTPSRTTKVSTLAAMQGQELVALYFGAQWRNECKRFVPVLSKFYKACCTTSQNLEVVYVSVDRTLLEFNDCYGRMPWLAMPTGTTLFKNSLTEQLKVIDLPAFVVLDPKTGHVVTTSGVAEIEALGDFDAGVATKLVQKWKNTKPIPACDLKMETTLKNGNLARGIVSWET
jgi:nucleoredoxin